MFRSAHCGERSEILDERECCSWGSLLQPWLAKFRGLSKHGLEQASRTYGFLRSLNLVGAPIHSLIDCVAVNVFR
jgi:hypothetical protein